LLFIDSRPSVKQCDSEERRVAPRLLGINLRSLGRRRQWGAQKQSARRGKLGGWGEGWGAGVLLLLLLLVVVVVVAVVAAEKAEKAGKPARAFL
jgi:hypothetical protein